MPDNFPNRKPIDEPSIDADPSRHQDMILALCQFAVGMVLVIFVGLLLFS